MNRNAFEQEVEEFCRCWLVDCIDDYHVEYQEVEDLPDIHAEISIEAQGRHYDLRMRIHPDADGDIAIDTGDDSYLEAEGVDFYLWLWIETMRKDDELLEKAVKSVDSAGLTTGHAGNWTELLDEVLDQSK